MKSPLLLGGLLLAAAIALAHPLINYLLQVSPTLGFIGIITITTCGAAGVMLLTAILDTHHDI